MITIALNKPNSLSIESVLAQTCQNWELIIEGEKLLDSPEDARIQYIQVVSPIGFKGDHIIYLRGGDKLLPNALEILSQALISPEVMAAYGYTKEFKYKNPNRFTTHNKEPILSDHSSEILFRRSILEEVEWDLKVLQKRLRKINKCDVNMPLVEKFFSQDMINKWEEQRKLRQRRQMKISIIFGVKTRARYAKRVIRSLLVQDLHRDLYDIVIVDFGSQDDLAEYINLIKASNVHYLSVPGSVQYDRARAYNIGAKHSQSEILVFSEVDLLFPKHALRTIRDHVIQNEKQISIIQQKNLEKLETAIIIGKTYSDYAEILKKAKLEDRPGINGCIALERQYFEAVGGFDEDYAGESQEVIDFIERLQQNNIQKSTCEQSYVLHMWHNEFPKDKDGYFDELYRRKRQIAIPTRNTNRDWGVLTKKKPDIMFMLSPRVWESGAIYKYVSQFLKQCYHIDMCGARAELRGKSACKYDIVYTTDWRLPIKFHSQSSKFVAGIFDFISWNDGAEHDMPSEKLQQRLELFEAISVPCRKLKEILTDFHPNTFYTPIGVDTEIFKPLKTRRRVSKNFTVGWVGKPEREHTIEGYLEHVKPICNQLPGMELFSAPGGEDVNGFMQMLGFYNAIDVLVVFHETSGDCKSILEAMSCGVPVITTRIGDVDEIIESGVNGIVIQRDEQSLTEALVTLQTKSEYRLQMGKIARETVVRKWDWRDKIHYWKELFDFVERSA